MSLIPICSCTKIPAVIFSVKNSVTSNIPAADVTSNPGPGNSVPCAPKTLVSWATYCPPIIRLEVKLLPILLFNESFTSPVCAK